MRNSVRYTTILFATFAITAVFNNCSKVGFSSQTANNNNIQCVAPCNGPGPNPSPSIRPTPNPTNTMPGSVQLSPIINAVAFEDLYYQPGVTPSANPDFDYNDFMTEFKIQEVANKQNQITDIYIDFYPRAVGAGYDHIFYLILTGTKTTPSLNSANLPITKPMFNGSAQVSLSYFDEKGNLTSAPSSTPYNQDIVVFQSTHAAFGSQGGQVDTILPRNYMSGVPGNYVNAVQNARVHIALDSPSLNPAPASGLIDPSTFRVILHPKDTNLDIDIINVDPKNFVGSSGYPWGFIIPTDWQWMTESVDIDQGYPLFAQYRNYLMGQPATGDFMNWFKYPIQPTDPTIVYPKVPWQEFLPAIP